MKSSKMHPEARAQRRAFIMFKRKRNILERGKFWRSQTRFGTMTEQQRKKMGWISLLN
jgi:hypothetical protein